MKILYVSGFHSTLEHDQIIGFLELGHEVFSTGHYVDFLNPVKSDALRDPILISNSNSDWISKFKKLNPNHQIHKQIYLDKSFVDEFDVVLVENCCPIPSQLKDIWQSIKHKPVIYRSYGQHQGDVENDIKECSKSGKIIKVRVASTESNIQNFAGIDFIIKGYVDENNYKDWNGFGNEVLTFNNFYDKRTWHSNTRIYEQVRRALRHREFSLYGMYNERVPECKGVLSYKDQLSAYRNCGVYFALGSKPAALTYNFQEAMMTGCPVVTWGKKLGAGIPDIYEVPDLAQNGIHCFQADSAEEATYYVNLLLTNRKLANDMSKAAREISMEFSSKEKNKKQWQNVLETATN